MPAMDMNTVNDPRLYYIGAGIVYLNLFDPETGLPTGYFDAGNATVVRPTNNDERFLKNESRTRYRARVVNLLLRRNIDIQFDFDEWSSRLVSAWWQGTPDVGTTQAATPIVDEEVTTAVMLGASYVLAARGPITGYSFQEAYGPTALVEGVDYVIDDINVPVVRILPDAVNIADGDTLEASYTPTAYTGTPFNLAIGTVSQIEAAVMFVGDPPNGPRLRYNWWKGILVPNGSLDLIQTGNENAPLSFTFSVSSDTTGHPDSPLGFIDQLLA